MSGEFGAAYTWCRESLTQIVTRIKHRMTGKRLGRLLESLYTDEVRWFIRTRDWPKGLRFDVFENDDPAPHLNIVFYRDNFIQFDTDAQLKIASVVQEVMTKLRGDGIPVYLAKMERAPKL
jgi:hypothetical protein